MIVFAFLESSGMSKVLIHHSDGSSLTTTLINRFFTWNIGMAFSTVEPGSFQGISRIRQKKAWNRYIFIRKRFLALHKIIIHFSSKLLTSIHTWFLWFEQFHMKSRHTVAIFSLKITKNRENCQSRNLHFLQSENGEITFTLHSRQFWSWPITRIYSTKIITYQWHLDW